MADQRPPLRQAPRGAMNAEISIVAGRLTQALLSEPGIPSRGCVACAGTVEGEILADERGRAWHLTCALAVLGEITRKDEDRGEAFQYSLGPFVPRCRRRNEQWRICRRPKGHGWPALHWNGRSGEEREVWK